MKINSKVVVVGQNVDSKYYRKQGRVVGKTGSGLIIIEFKLGGVSKKTRALEAFEPDSLLTREEFNAVLKKERDDF